MSNDKVDQKEILVNYFSEKFGLKQNELDIFKATDIKFYKGGEVLFRDGQNTDKCYFVIKGCLRQYFVNEEGNEVTINFFTEFQPVTVITVSKTCNNYFLQCIEDTYIAAGDAQMTEKYYRNFPNIESVSRQITEEHLMNTQERITKLLTMSPSERYLDLIKTQPELLQRIPQNLIAGYLGVQPESLSRIKKKIAEKRKMQ